MAVKGAVLGDILGSQYEFKRPHNLDWKNSPLISGLPMSFTDDTVMTLAIKKALNEEKDLVETMVEVGRKYPYFKILYCYLMVITFNSNVFKSRSIY